MTFKGVSDLADFSHSEVIRASLVAFLDDSLIRIGAVANAASGLYGGNFSTLYYADEPYANGKVWNSPKKNWVWEYDAEAIPVSGVYVNGALVTSGYQIDYKNGRIIFDTAINRNSSVSVNYSYKTFHIDDFESLPLFSRLQQQSIRVEQNVPNSGGLIELVGNRVQLPAIAIEMVTDDQFYPYELGSQTMKMTKSVILHILGTKDTKRVIDKVADIISIQKGKTIGVFDVEQVIRATGQPLTFQGYVNNPSGTYNNLINNYRWTYGLQGGKVYVDNAYKSEATDINGLYHVPVRWEIEGVLYTD